MSYWHYGLIAMIVTIVVMTIASMFAGYKLGRVFLVVWIFSSVAFAIISLVGRMKNNFGINGSGSWGERGLLPEIFNWYIWEISGLVGLIAALIFTYAVYSAGKPR